MTRSDTSPLQVEVTTAADVTVVTVTGEIDIASMPQLRDALRNATAACGPLLVIDLTAVPYCDSSGLGVIVGTYKRVRHAQGSMVLVVAELGQVATMLKVTALTKVFEIYRESRMAIHALNASRNGLGNG